MLSAGFLGRPLRPSLILDLRNPGEVLDGRITWTRATTALRTNSAGLLASVASGLPRWDYHPTTHALRGVLVEGAATNLFLRSQEFDNASWSKTRSSISANAATAPDGTVTADKLVEDGTANNTHDVRQTVSKVASSITYTVSIYAKAAERTWAFLWLHGTSQSNRGEAWFNLGMGTKGAVRTQGTGFSTPTSDIEDVGGGWYRIWLTVTSNTDTTIGLLAGGAVADGNSNTNGDGVSGWYLWGAQLETNSFPTSYVATTSAQGTRAADVPTMPISAFPFSSGEGTLVARASSFANDSTQRRAVSISDGTANNYVDLSRIGSTQQSRAVAVSGGTATFNSLTAAWPTGAVATLANAWRLDDFAACLGGGTVVTDTSGAVPGGLTTMRIGDVNGFNPWCGHLQLVAVYPRRLSNAELQKVTA